MALSLDAWKGLSMGVFTFISIFGAWVAIIMKEKAKQLYVTCGVLFSAGVLLAAGFVHLLVDGNEQFTNMGIDNFPWAFSISGITIVCLMSFEIGLDRWIDDYMKKKGTGVDVDDCTDASSVTAATPLMTSEEVAGKNAASAITGGLGHSHSHPVHPGETPPDPFTAIILTLALSIHSVIEGLGLGASADTSDIQSAFIAIAIHKCFTTFALAQGMITSGYWEKGNRKWFYLSIGLFIGIALLGIVIGWAVSPEEENALTAVLISITSGSFVYVALLELLPEETKHVKEERLPVLPVITFFVAGYVFMSMLAIWV